MRTKILDQERSISTLADAVQRQVGLLEHFRAEVDSMKKSNLSSSQNGTLATSTSEDASMIQSRSSQPGLQHVADSAEDDSLTRKKSSRGSRAVIPAGAADPVISSDSSRDGKRDRSRSSPRKTDRKSSKREKRETPSRADSGFESDSTPTRVRRRSVTSGTPSRTTVVNRAEGASIMEPPSSDSKAIMVRSRSQTLHERSSTSADSTIRKDSEVNVKRQSSVRDKDRDRDSSKRRMESKSADSVPRQSSKITVRSPKSKSSAKLVLSPSDLAEGSPASGANASGGDTNVGGVELTRRSSKPKVRRPASTTFGADVLRRSSDKDILASPAQTSPISSPITSPKPRPSKSKSTRANKLLEQLTPAEQAETASGGLAVTQADVSPRHEGLLSRSASSSSELGLKSPSWPQPPTSSADRVLSPDTGSRRNSSKDITSPKLEAQNSQDKLSRRQGNESEVVSVADGDDNDDDLPSRQSYGESDASSGADDNKTKQIIRKVNIFAAGGARVFGVPLAQCQLDERATVPVVLASLANTLKAEKPAPGDLFDKRVDPAKIDGLKKLLESTRESITLKETDIYVVAATLKRFFSDLPEPLLTPHMRKQWLQVADIDDDVVRVPAIRSLFHALERVNRKVLEYMVIFFNRLVDNSNSQLTLKQIATAFGPLFLRPVPANLISTPVSAGPWGSSSSSRPEVKREASSIGADALSGDFADFTPEMLEEKSVTLLAVFMRQYPNIFLLKCPGIEYHKRTFHVRAATVDNFVGLMLDSNYIEREFHEIFWITYPYFIDSDDLLMRFTDLYHEYNATSRWESRYRMKILFVVKLWVRRLGVALQQDESFKDDLSRFITEALRMVENSPEDTLEKPMLLSLQSMQFAGAADAEGRSIIDRIMAGAGAGSQAGAPQSPAAHTRMQRSPSGKKILSLKGAPLDVLQLDGKSLAFQITLIDYKLVHMITPSELINGNSMDQNKSPNYSAMVSYINRITHWVAFEILSRPTPADRARVLAYFIDVAYYCRKMCNFNGSWAVFGAFGLHPVSRLSQTWERLPRRDASRHKKLSALFEPRLNFSEYRKQMDRAIHEGSCVPILAFLPKDIIRFETDPTFTEDRLVDFDKMRGIFQTLQLLSHCQNDPGVPAGKVDELWELLLGLPDLEGDDLDALSYKAEPKK
jgi:hypothetical protein